MNAVQDIKRRFRAKRAALKTHRIELPIVAGTAPCSDCWAQPGGPHMLSCEQVSFEQFTAFLDGAR